MNWLDTLTESGLLITYHIGEEFLIAVICFMIARRYFAGSGETSDIEAPEDRARVTLAGAAFVVLGLSSLTHALIHAARFDNNLLYQTLLGYCLGFLILILARSAEKPSTKQAMPLLYLPLLALLVPEIYSQFPLFGKFRPIVWIAVAYLSAVVSILFIGTFYRSRSKRMLWATLGFVLIAISSIFLFFPASIGSPPWLHGHLFRPVGFLLLFFAVTPEESLQFGGSILDKTLSAFSLLAAIPLLLFGTIVYYENFAPIAPEIRQLLVFLFLLVAFAVAFIFGLGVIIRLINPLLELKNSVNRLVEEGLERKTEINRNDEIGELSDAFNEMTVNLKHAVEEQERLGRLASTGELAATLAHEIKNPLNAIGGAAAYIGRNYRGTLIEEFVKIISDEVYRINKLTGTLLNFARPVPPNPSPHNINELVEDTVFLMRQESQDQHIALEKKLSPHLPPVNCDQNQIRQILINLIINAFDALDERGRVCVQTEASNGGVHISVEDDGPGIAPEDMKQIFNPFFTTKTRGTGLGLAISKKIAREHQGDLLVKSTRGRGSKFTLVLRGGDWE
jgi:signal transduction histidine kinase